MYLHMFDTVDTSFSYEREMIVCSFLQDLSTEGKGRSLQLIYNAHTAFLLRGAEMLEPIGGLMKFGGSKCNKDSSVTSLLNLFPVFESICFSIYIIHRCNTP